jgi:ornithine cyclodeaminase/alanine dehydrogenase-like protein (mu-crystallin family)
MPLLISDEEVKKILTIEDALDAVESAFRQYGRQLAGGNGFEYRFPPPPKRELRIEGKNLPHGDPKNHFISQGIASLEDTKMSVLQHTLWFQNRKAGIFHLIDNASGNTIAIVMNNSGYISWMRTCAEGAIAAKYLSRENARIAGIVGTGLQGRGQLQFLTRVRTIEKAFVHSGRRRDEKFAREMGENLGIEVVAANTVEDVARTSDILVTVTRATTPIIKGEWIAQGTHINGIGADCPLKAELDAETLKKADKLIIDCEQMLNVAQMRLPMEQGILQAENIYGTIGEIVAGIKPGRETSSEITLYQSTGMTIPYVTINARIFEKARKMGLGRETPSIL